MEGNETDVDCEKIFDAPKKTHKSNVWHYFGFFKREGKLDKTHVICKQCRVAIKYAGNTTNLAKHMKRRHGVDTSAAAPPSSPSDSTEAPDTPSGSKADDKNSRSIKSFVGQMTPGQLTVRFLIISYSFSTENKNSEITEKCIVEF